MVLVDLTQDAVNLSVPLPQADATGQFPESEFLAKGRHSQKFVSPVPFDQIKKVRMIGVYENATQRYLLGFADEKDIGQNKGEIRIFDAKNANQPLGIILFSDNTHMEVYIEFYGYNPQHGSDSLSDIYDSGKQAIRVYLHFERK